MEIYNDIQEHRVTMLNLSYSEFTCYLDVNALKGMLEAFCNFKVW